MLTELAQVYTMKKGLRRVTFVLFTDGCYCQIYKDGSMSEITNDFADLFLTLICRGWKPIN